MRLLAALAVLGLLAALALQQLPKMAQVAERAAPPAQKCVSVGGAVSYTWH
jgi:hypothetical protein